MTPHPQTGPFLVGARLIARDETALANAVIYSSITFPDTTKDVYHVVNDNAEPRVLSYDGLLELYAQPTEVMPMVEHEGWCRLFKVDVNAV